MTSNTISLTESAYAGTPLWTMTECTRGLAIEGIVRRWVESTGKETNDSDPGTCVDGSKRGQNQAEYDFMVEDDRTEVKSARLFFNKLCGRWDAHWASIKSKLHDRLYLALYSHRGLDIFLHDGSFGLMCNGNSVSVRGDAVCVRGPGNTECIEGALAAIREKMAPMFKAHISHDDLRTCIQILWSSA